MSKSKDGIKLIIAGSRTITNYEKVKPMIDKIIKDNKIKVAEVFSGKAAGMDKLGEQWADELKIPIKSFPADWKNISIKGALIKEGQYGKYNALAGIWRNHKMGDEADAAIVIWTGGSCGSADMIDYMNKINKPVYTIMVNV